MHRPTKIALVAILMFSLFLNIVLLIIIIGFRTYELSLRNNITSLEEANGSEVMRYDTINARMLRELRNVEEVSTVETEEGEKAFSSQIFTFKFSFPESFGEVTSNSSKTVFQDGKVLCLNETLLFSNNSIKISLFNGSNECFWEAPTVNASQQTALSSNGKSFGVNILQNGLSVAEYLTMEQVTTRVLIEGASDDIQNIIDIVESSTFENTLLSTETSTVTTLSQ